LNMSSQFFVWAGLGVMGWFWWLEASYSKKNTQCTQLDHLSSAEYFFVISNYFTYVIVIWFFLMLSN